MVDLAAEVTRAFGVVADTLPTVLVSAVYHSSTGSTYNPATGESTDTATEVTLSAVKTAFAIKEVDGVRVKPGDIKLLIDPAALVSGGSLITPKAADWLEIASQKWEVIDILGAPGNAIWKLQCRRA